VTVTIANATSNPVLTTSGMSVNLYSGVTVSDTASLTTAETVTITLSQSVSNAPGDNFSFSPAATGFGTISDLLAEALSTLVLELSQKPDLLEVIQTSLPLY
jgi:hypothetical protein